MGMGILMTAGERTHIEEGASFESFFQREYPRLVRAMWVVTRDQSEAEDLAQDSMARVLERWDRVAMLESPQGYLYRTAMNTHRKVARRKLIARRHAQSNIGSGTSEDIVEGTLLRMQWERALIAVSPDERKAITLIDFMGFDYADASQILSVKVVTLRGHVHRARIKLREAMNEEGDL